MSAVLIIVMNGTKVLDSGTGIVLCHDTKGSKTYVLTCSHNIRAIGRPVADASVNPIRIVVNGMDAKDIGDTELARFDLAVLTVQGKVGDRSRLKIPSSSFGPVCCEGFTNFFQQQYARHEVKGKAQRTIQTVMPDGVSLGYLEIKPNRGSPRFAKGLSGAPVYDQKKKNVIGVARILDESADSAPIGYAIQFSPEVLAVVQQVVPFDILGAVSAPDRPPPPPPPLPESLAKDDVQKGRWGGQSEGYGRRLRIENLVEYKRYFLVDAVLEATDDTPLVGPFVFHLHDTFAKSVIWIRRTNGKRAVLEEIYATGTFTFGVQFKDGEGKWRSLEFDLGEWDDGRLRDKYD
jgi:hypothetical protein